MEHPFNRSNWNPSRHGCYYPQAQIQPISTKPKVINIPVHFVSSGDNESRPMPALSTEEARAAASVKIQKVVRGFLVRKNARVVRRVLSEVQEIEQTLRQEETKIRVDGKERLRVSEALMALLLRLDSVRGVRDFRKKVIQRVMALQEAVDSMIPTGAGSEISMSEEAKESSRDPEKENEEILKDDGDGVPQPFSMSFDSLVLTTEGEEGKGTGSQAAKESVIPDHEEEGKGTEGEAAEEAVIPDHEEETNQIRDLEDGNNKAETEILLGFESSPNSRSNPSGLQIIDDASRLPVAVDEVVMKDDEQGELQHSSLSVEAAEAKAEEGKGMREAMEMMTTENKILKDMVAELCSRSVEQCRLMEGLAGRVEHLERAVHRMERRKRKKSGAGVCSVNSSSK